MAAPSGVKFAGKDYEDKRPRDRYVAEAKRLLAVVRGLGIPDRS